MTTKYEVTVEIDATGPTDTLLVVATIDAPDQQTASIWRTKLENFVGELTGGLTTVAGTSVERTVSAARSVA